MLSIESQSLPHTYNGLAGSDTIKTTHEFKQRRRDLKLANHSLFKQWQSPLSSIPTSAIRPSVSTPELPQISVASISTTEVDHYIDQCALISAHANLTSPLQRLLQRERPGTALSNDPSPSTSTLLPIMYSANTDRLRGKVAHGSLVVESGSFAATACWTPPASSAKPLPKSALVDLVRQGQCCLAEFLSKMEAAKEKYLYTRNTRYWHLTMMARDPRREHVPGAVRAVIEPFLTAAEIEGVPVWLEAGSEKARDVYKHFGFVECDVVVVAGVKMWCMIRY